jgi:hypothetical protein
VDRRGSGQGGEQESHQHFQVFPPSTMTTFICIIVFIVHCMFSVFLRILGCLDYRSSIFFKEFFGYILRMFFVINTEKGRNFCFSYCLLRIGYALRNFDNGRFWPLNTVSLGTLKYVIEKEKKVLKRNTYCHQNNKGEG